MSKNYSIEEIRQTRETNKIGLEMFGMDFNDDSFSYSIEVSIENLQNELDRIINEFQNIGQKEIDNEYYFYQDRTFLEEKLLAISEMKVVYLYKNFEISVKKLISAAYGIKTKNFYKWQNIIDFFKSKNIKYAELIGFQEINQLREINNSIKHSFNLINNKTENISEFKNLKNVRHYELNKFHERVKGSPYKFINNLSESIFRDLYEFDNYRINKAAELFALRMDEKTAKKFAELLISKY